MTFFDMISMSAENLFRRKLRTFLTMLGVLIGTASIVAMMSIGIGMQELVMEEYSSYGTITQITVSEGMSDSSTGTKNDSSKLTDSMIKELEKIEHVKSVDATLSFDLTLQQGKYTGWCMLKGVTAEHLKEIKVGEGRLPEASSDSVLEVLAGNTVITNFYDPNNFEGTYYYMSNKLPDVDLMNKVTKVSTYDQYAYYRQELQSQKQGQEETEDGTGSQDAYINPEVRFRTKIVGVKEGEPTEYDMESDYMLVDIDQLKSYLTRNFKKGEIPNQPYNSKNKPFNEWVYNQVTVDVDEADNVEMVLTNIQDMGFNAQSNKELLDSAQKIFKIIELVLGAIGMIAFLVAAIGIANTMMMSTYERTKEIGVMKVLGCDMKDIQRLFLTEAGFIGFFGGLMGLIFTLGLSALANKLTASFMAAEMGLGGTAAKISVIPLWLMVLSIVFATVMGMIAGYFPAKRAMKLSPLAAIRTE
ncbi:MAG: ABC transporter permease [Lachnospiraceae bacterium]|nr:ABC transporter permease [Lachnospiraceae bacterium]